MKMNKEYVTPNINVIFVATGDVITTSPAFFDSLENWKNDVFAQE